MSDVQPASKKGRPSLFGTVNKTTAKQQADPPPAEQADAAGRPSRRSATRGRQDRQDKRQIAGFFSAECAKQLRMLAAEHDTTVQELLREGLNMMFQTHGKPPIA
jgi:hypothetical protein